MIVNISNTVDRTFEHQRFASDKHPGIQLVIGIDELENRFVHLLSEDLIDFCTVEETGRVIEAIAELKDFTLSHQHS